MPPTVLMTEGPRDGGGSPTEEGPVAEEGPRDGGGSVTDRGAGRLSGAMGLDRASILWP